MEDKKRSLFPNHIQPSPPEVEALIMEERNRSQDILVRDLATLCFTIGRTTTQKSNIHPLQIFERFVHSNRNSGPLRDGTDVIIFHLLFPEEDVSRKYGMQETRLSKVLAKVLVSQGMPERQIAGISKWDAPYEDTGAGRHGCLGEEVRQVLNVSNQNRNNHGGKTIHDLESSLNQLARHCRFSQHSAFGDETPLQSVESILNDLYTSVNPEEAAFITQVILKDLRPLYYSLTMVHTTYNLLKEKSKVHEFKLHQAMRVWHPQLPSIYRACANLDKSFEILHNGISPPFCPILGVPVQIPKCYKGRSCEDAIRTLGDAKQVFCEKKYDGERMQIHIDLSLPYQQQITIFSKSRRNSTLERYKTHEIIRAALGLPQRSVQHPYLSIRLSDDRPFRPLKSGGILEAEMVAYSENLQRIDEFWRIRSLLSSPHKIPVDCEIGFTLETELESRNPQDPTTNGISGRELDLSLEYSPEERCSLESDGTDQDTRHFMLVFFDALFLDGRNLLKESYSSRRSILEDLIVPIEGFSMIAARTPLDMTKFERCQHLRSILSLSISSFEEGLVLKAGESIYNSSEFPWVKLKRFLIPGLGDCLDMVVIGASWDRDRARELRVGTDTLTTFYVAAIHDERGADLSRSSRRSNLQGEKKLHLQCLFTVSYGLTREQLERLNFEIKLQSPVSASSKDTSTLPYRIALRPGLLPPSFYLQRPLLFELYGDGFDKPVGSNCYVIRWPSVSKIYREEERLWTEGETIESFNRKAYAAVGRDTTSKLSKIKAARMWGLSPDTSPEARSIKKRKRIQNNFLEKLNGEQDFFTGEESRELRHIPISTYEIVSGPQQGQARTPKPPVIRGISQLLSTLDRSTNDLSRIEPCKGSRNQGVGSARMGANTDDHIRKGTGIKYKPENNGRMLTRCTMNSPHSPSSIGLYPRMAESNVRQTESMNQRKTQITFDSLVFNSFLLIYQPLYPKNAQRTMHMGLRSWLPTSRLLSTIEALLLGIGWTPRTTTIPHKINKGVIFASSAEAPALIEKLRVRCKELKDEGREMGEITEILLICSDDLAIQDGGSNNERLANVIWSSRYI
ncbi:hypothetical protein CPB86DRAFT_730576 [Serendipita vermifera]|nr:hypothetical protein CPB86DRAFT_730576 [Serendipita vermifera]